MGSIILHELKNKIMQLFLDCNAWYGKLFIFSKVAKLPISFCSFSYVVTIFNVCPHEVSIEIHDLASLGLELHPIQVMLSF